MDKTDLVYSLVQEGKIYFLSRLRRFGFGFGFFLFSLFPESKFHDGYIIAYRIAKFKCGRGG